MIGKVGKWLTLAMAGVLVFALLATAGLYWRLRQGPLHLAMLKPYVLEALDNAVAGAGLKVRFRDVVLEVSDDLVPTIRLRDISLGMPDGRVVAAAPRAALSLSGRALLSGRLMATRLDLERPRVWLRRSREGGIFLGIGARPGAAPGGEKGSAARSGYDLFGLVRLLRQQARRDKGRQGVIGGLQALEISNAEIVLVDEKLGIHWLAPAADLTLRSVPYGYALFATAQVHGAGRPWHVEAGASWRRDTGRVSVSLQIQDVFLSDLLTSFVSASSALQRLRLPVSGRLDFELDNAGRLLAASGEMLVGRGEIAFPKLFSRPLAVREGALFAKFDPDENRVVIRSGHLLTSVGRFDLGGNLRLLPGPGGTVQALALDLNMRRGAIATRHDRGDNAVFPWRRASLQALLHPGQASVRIRDLQLWADKGAVRLRGMLRAEPEGVGIYVSGRARDISHQLLKASWPAKIGAGAREWIGQHVHGGRIAEATFRLAIPASVLNAAIDHYRPMPEKVADVRFEVRDVRFTYVPGWPAIDGAQGRGVMTGNTFRVELTRGSSRLPSGRTLSLVHGELRVRDLAARVSPGDVRVKARGRAEGFLELADLPPLRLVRKSGLEKDELRGDVVASMHLKMPFSRHMTGDDIRLQTLKAKVNDVSIGSLVVPGLQLRGGHMELRYARGVLRAKGRGRVADLPVQFEWRRGFGPEAGKTSPLLVLRTTLDDAARRRLGVDLSAWMQGPVTVEARMRPGKAVARKIRINAGLDKVRMRLPAIGWRREAQEGTKASFDLLLKGRKGISIEHLSVSGPGGLRVTGKLRLDGAGNFREATFSRFELGPSNRLALGLEREGEGLKVLAAGPIFDARPLITRLFAPRQETDKTLRSAFVRVNLREVMALRGERVRDVRGEVEMRDGLVRRASLTGRFASSGRKVVLDLVPAGNGLRRLRIVSDDAGALLRASGLYSRIIGGRAEFTALLKGGDDGGVQRGLLVMRHFTVRGDERLSRLRRRNGRQGAGRGPRRGQKFKKLVLPFSTDKRFIRIGDALVRSPEIGATANGLIRRADGAMDIGGVIIPAYALNSALGNIPVLGMLLTGGRGQGVFGMTYALKGTINKPKFIVNPLSAVAPGVLRHFFQLGGHQVNPDGTPKWRNKQKPRRRSRTNLANGG